jgi:hypothetical protein
MADYRVLLHECCWLVNNADYATAHPEAISRVAVVGSRRGEPCV